MEAWNSPLLVWFIGDIPTFSGRNLMKVFIFLFQESVLGPCLLLQVQNLQAMALATPKRSGVVSMVDHDKFHKFMPTYIKYENITQD